MKRGQVTAFIIVGIVLLVVIVAAFLIYSKFVKEQLTPEQEERLISTQVEPIKTLIKDCTEKTLQENIVLIGYQSGYYDPPYYQQLGKYKVAYICHKEPDNVNRLPMLEKVKSEIEKYSSVTNFEDKIKSCINDFKAFKEQGIKIKEGTFNLKISEINPTDITAIINYPLTISKGDYSTEIKEISVNIPSGLGIAHKVATDIVNDECTGKEFDIDSYIIKNPLLVRIERQLDGGNLYYYLTTIPQKNEPEYNFHFIIQK